MSSPIEVKKQLKSEYDRAYYQRTKEIRAQRQKQKLKIKYVDKEQYLINKYYMITERCTNPNNKRAKYYFNKELMSKSDFISFSLNDLGFNLLFNNWIESNYAFKLTPVPDRIDSKLGYVAHNIEWVTFSENSRRSANNLWDALNE